MTSASVPGVCILDSIFGSCGNIWKVGRLPPSNPGLLLFKMKIMKSFDRNLVKTATAVKHRTWVGNRAVWRNIDNHAVICSADASMDPMSQFCPKFAEMLEFDSNQTLNFCCS